jgi:histidyl-tRNA synthetase
MKIPRCKGTRDLLPQDMAKFRRIEAAFRDCCLGWGYQEIRTPTLEYLHLFTSAGTLSPDMLGRVYSFLDWDGWSGERVALRPDGTIPVARLYVENFQNLPVAKFFYVENVFAFEGSGKESRERWQCGAELIGVSRLEGDVELISMALETMEKLEIKPVELRLAHAGLIKAVLEGLGLSGERGADVMDQVFSGNMAVLSSLKGKNPGLEMHLPLLFGVKGDNPDFVENLRRFLVPTLPELGPSLDELARIANLLTGLDFSYQIDFTSGRGFEYYTGIIFSFYCSEHRLGGGGRYDELIPLVGGKKKSASGFALYMDELMRLVKDKAWRERIVVKAKDAEGLKPSLALARSLREAGYVAEFDLGFRDTTDFRWIVNMRSSKGIELIDQRSGKRQRGSSPAEILRLLEEARCE